MELDWSHTLRKPNTIITRQALKWSLHETGAGEDLEQEKGNNESAQRPGIHMEGSEVKSQEQGLLEGLYPWPVLFRKGMAVMMMYLLITGMVEFHGATWQRR